MKQRVSRKGIKKKQTNILKTYNKQRRQWCYQINLIGLNINIEQALDEFLINEFNQYNLESKDSTKLLSNCQLKFYQDNFKKQLIQETSSFINNNIQQNDIFLKYKEEDIQQIKIQQTTQQLLTASSDDSPNLKTFTYQLLNYNSIKQDEWCHAIAINHDCSIVVSGSKNQIKVFEFKLGALKLIQLLNQHQYIVSTLNFMKRSNCFISGSHDKSIILWERNYNFQWICLQKLIDHTQAVVCLVINYNEDVIISGSGDNSIKFWVNQNEWKCQQTITQHIGTVYGLSLHKQQNRVISCGRDKFILVIEQSAQNKQWLVIQKIQVEQFGVNVCFIDSNTFTFKPYKYEYIYIYEKNSSNNQYIKTKDIQLKGNSDYSSFLSKYIKKKCILVNKNSSNVNLIRMKPNREFKIEESIEFKTVNVYGCVSDDGQYLITWDDEQREYQIRQYKEL